MAEKKLSKVPLFKDFDIVFLTYLAEHVTGIATLLWACRVDGSHPEQVSPILNILL